MTVRIVMHTYEATRPIATGLENHAKQLIYTLQQEYDLEAIVQTNRRVALFSQATDKLSLFSRLLNGIKLCATAVGMFFKFFLCSLDDVFHQTLLVIELKKIENKDRLPKLYQSFDKLHYSPDFYDRIKLFYWLHRRKALVNIPQLNGVNVFWATSPFPMYMEKALNVCTVHDLFYKSAVVFFSEMSNNTHLKIGQILNQFDLIFSISHYTRQQIIECFPHINVDKIHVSHQAMPKKNLLFLEFNQERIILAKRGLESKAFLLHVGSLIPRKNHIKLIQAFLACELQYPLVLVGKKTKYSDKKVIQLIKNNPHKIIWLEYVSEQEINTLYRYAKAFIFPSFLEGFGIPILEAFHHRCPVVTSNTSAIPEVAGDAVIYVNPESVMDIKRGVQLILENQVLREQLIRAGEQQLLKFSDDIVLKKINQGLGWAIKNRVKDVL